MTLSRLLSLGLLLSAATTLAQTPDTTASARYVALAVGNEWHVSGERFNGYWTEYETRRYVVESEPPDAPGSFAVVWTGRYQQFPNSPVILTGGSGTWMYDATAQQATGGPMPSAPCPLGAPFGAPVVCASQGTYQVSGGPGQTVTVGGQTVTATRKGFARSGSGPNYIFSIRYEYAAGIGQTLYEQSSANSTDSNRESWRLSYARVGGTEYGQPLSFPSAGDDAPAGGALDLHVWPNPASTAATLRVTLDAPATVRLTLTDALGRDVLTDVRALAAGPQTLAVDAARLAPGVYVVRVAAGVRVGTHRLVVSR